MGSGKWEGVFYEKMCIVSLGFALRHCCEDEDGYEGSI